MIHITFFLYSSELSSYGKFLALSQVHLKDLGRGVPTQYRNNDIRISFVLDPTDTSGQMCLNLQAPASLIHDMSEGKFRPAENCTVPSSSASGDDGTATITTVNVTSYADGEVPHGWCDGGTVFRMGLEGNPSWTVDVSGDDLAVIHLHLVATSVFLFAIVALAVVGIVVRGCVCQSQSRHHSRRQQQLKSEDDDDELIY